MEKHPKITEVRIRKTLERIRLLVYRDTVPLRASAWTVGGEPVTHDQAARQVFAPFAVGDRWGAAWDTVWFRFEGEVPHAWAGREVVALVRLGSRGGEGFTCEGLVWRDGVPIRALNVFRSDVPVAAPAKGGECVDFRVEAAANPSTEGGTGYRIAPRCGTVPLFRLEQAELACFDREADALLHDYRVAAEAMFVLPGGPRRARLLYALNDAANRLDPACPATVPAAREALRGVLACRNGDSAHHVSAVGHAHIDTAWLWPLRETIRKCARSFSTALAYMEEYPDYVFGCSQPQQYAWMKAYYPTIYEGIKKAVARGQWELIGSMWIEPDCNLPSGESLVRQVLHGKNFFLDEFGYETHDLWIPDVFGYSAALPQIMRRSGIDSFVTQKISWNQTNPFPHHTFLWEGLDGSRVFAHFPPADTYNADLAPTILHYVETNFRDHDRAGRSLLAYGWGDGGGGPTTAMLEAAARLRDFEGLPKVTQEKVSAFLPKAWADARDLPVWSGELYLELHRGTYTTQAAVKRANRRCEHLLHDAEFYAVLVPDAGVDRVNDPRAVHDVARPGEHTVAAYLDRAWKLLLLNQFHDIIPGSSIAWVYEDAARDHATVEHLCEAVAGPARRALAARIDTGPTRSPLLVFNPTGFDRQEVVSLPSGASALVSAPAYGYIVHDLAAPASDLPPVSVSADESGAVLDNGIVRAVLDTEGRLTSLHDYRLNRELIPAGERGNVFELYQDYPNAHDAWDIDPFALETGAEVAGTGGTLEVGESGPLRVEVRVSHRIGASEVTQRVRLRAGSARLDFDTEVDWQENRRLLKVAFPVNVRAARATYETQFGHVERPTHRNTSWDTARFEVCAHRWADLSEGDSHGVALLNDGKYGHAIHGYTLRLSLLRAPAEPDPTADRGHHRFTYALLSHPGDFRAGGVMAEAAALNARLDLITISPQDGGAGSLARQSFFSVDQANVVLDTVKPAEREDAIIVRMYEAHGTRRRVTFRTSLPVRTLVRADLMERTLEAVPHHNGAVTFEIAPFEIVTWKITRA